MIAKKHISIFAVALMAVAVVVCFLAMGYADTLSEKLGGLGVKMEYETRLFDTDAPISVNIKMDEDEWKKMLSNAQSEEYYVCDVKINDTTINNVAVRPKGNTSLSSIAMDPDTDRFSFKLEFDHFVKGQTCYGLDKLILNNNYADPTNMKETIVYDMYQYLGADASLYNYAKVFVNGEYWGIYLALEGVESSSCLETTEHRMVNCISRTVWILVEPCLRRTPMMPLPLIRGIKKGQANSGLDRETAAVSQ